MSKRTSTDGTGQQNGVTRRGFLKGAGLAAAGGAILETGLLSHAQTASGPTTLGPGAVPVTLRVNGKELRLQLEPRTTLAEALRGPADLTGTKVVCDRGSCSACTVWLDGMPVNSCMTFALDVGGREITTIEGLTRNGSPHPVLTAFVEHDAMQCGFCTPGMAMSCAALLEHNAKPTLDDVRQATSGNLCRCGTYPKVFEATLAASQSRGGKRGA